MEKVEEAWSGKTLGLIKAVESEARNLLNVNHKKEKKNNAFVT